MKAQSAASQHWERYDGAVPRGTGFVRRAYGLRCVGLAMGCFLVQTVLWSQHATIATRLFVLAYCFAWPYVGFLLARHRALPGKAERRNIYVDNFIGGMIVVAMKFSWLPSTLILLMFMMNNVAAGGGRLLARGALVCMMGCGAGMVCIGVAFDWSGLSASTIASAPMLIVYPLSLGLVTHRTSLKLAARSRELKRLNERDTLTGLLNRATLIARLNARLQTRVKESRVSVLFIDMDGFKAINDSLGHQCGDVLLAEVAARLAATMDDTEDIGRYGGDEFVIVSVRAALSDVTALADALIEAVSPLVGLNGTNVQPRLSVGISTSPDHGKDAQTLLTRADSAMYVAKRDGCNQPVMFGCAISSAPAHIAVA